MDIYQLVNGCLVTEHAVASIYRRFMQIFPQEKEFWEDLYEDEKKHSSFLMELADSGRFDEMQAADLGFSMPLLDRTRTFVTNIREYVEFNPVSFGDALRMALKLEETMVEAFTNGLIADLSPYDKNAFLQILRDEETHISKIKNMLIARGFLKLS